MSSNQKDTPVVRQLPQAGSPPLDEDGRPMARVAMQASELIGLPNFSNVTVGPALVERWVKDTPEDRERGLRMCAEETAGMISQQRQAVLDALRAIGVRTTK